MESFNCPLSCILRHVRAVLSAVLYFYQNSKHARIDTNRTYLGIGLGNLVSQVQSAHSQSSDAKSTKTTRGKMPSWSIIIDHPSIQHFRENAEISCSSRQFF